MLTSRVKNLILLSTTSTTRFSTIAIASMPPNRSEMIVKTALDGKYYIVAIAILFDVIAIATPS